MAVLSTNKSCSLDFQETIHRKLCRWGFSCSYVLPLTSRAGVFYLLYSVSHKHMEASCIVPYVVQGHLTVSPEHFVHVFIVEVWHPVQADLSGPYA